MGKPPNKSNYHPYSQTHYVHHPHRDTSKFELVPHTGMSEEGPEYLQGRDADSHGRYYPTDHIQEYHSCSFGVYSHEAYSQDQQDHDNDQFETVLDSRSSKSLETSKKSGYNDQNGGTYGDDELPPLEVHRVVFVITVQKVREGSYLVYSQLYDIEVVLRVELIRTIMSDRYSTPRSSTERSIELRSKVVIEGSNVDSPVLGESTQSQYE